MTKNYYVPVDLRFWQKVKFGEGMNDCWEWTGFCFPSGHGQFHIPDIGDVKASRAIWLIYNGPLESSDYICHRCDNAKCVRLDHLYKGTHQTNQADKRGKVKHRHENATYVKLNWKLAREIRALNLPAPSNRKNIRGHLPKGMYSSSEVAAKFGVTASTVARIWANEDKGGWREEV